MQPQNNFGGGFSNTEGSYIYNGEGIGRQTDYDRQGMGGMHFGTLFRLEKYVRVVDNKVPGP